ncbi:MAG TPA: RES domain-containing protein [Candidatus Limnocylindrales bacterium]|nr:RES domain-containing protein [Candidatus Limnocylindrales bacterium]
MTAPRPDLVRYRGPVWCHVPADEQLDLSRLAEADSADDRWNARGEPTIYLALDRSIALAEFGRHVDGHGRRRFLRFSVSEATSSCSPSVSARPRRGCASRQRRASSTCPTDRAAVAGPETRV